MNDLDIRAIGNIDYKLVTTVLTAEVDAMRQKGLKNFIGKGERELQEWSSSRRSEVRFAIVLMNVDAPALLTAVGADDTALFCTHCMKQVIDSRTWCPARRRDHEDMEAERTEIHEKKIGLVITQLQQRHADVCKLFCERIQRLPSARFAHGMYWHPVRGDTSLLGALHFSLPKKDVTNTSTNVNRAILTVYATTASDVRLVVVPISHTNSHTPQITTSPSHRPTPTSFARRPLSFSESIESDTLVPMTRNRQTATSPSSASSTAGGGTSAATLEQLAGITSTVKRPNSSSASLTSIRYAADNRLPLGWVLDRQLLQEASTHKNGSAPPPYHFMSRHQQQRVDINPDGGISPPTISQFTHPSMPATLTQKDHLESISSTTSELNEPCPTVEVHLCAPYRDEQQQQLYTSVPTSPTGINSPSRVQSFGWTSPQNAASGGNRRVNNDATPPKAGFTRLHSFLGQEQQQPSPSKATPDSMTQSGGHHLSFTAGSTTQGGGVRSLGDSMWGATSGGASFITGSGGNALLNSTKLPPVEPRHYFKKVPQQNSIHHVDATTSSKQLMHPHQHAYTVDITDLVRREVVRGETRLTIAVVVEKLPDLVPSGHHTANNNHSTSNIPAVSPINHHHHIPSSINNTNILSKSGSMLTPLQNSSSEPSNMMIAAAHDGVNVFPSLRPTLEVRLTDMEALCGCGANPGPETTPWTSVDQPPSKNHPTSHHQNTAATATKRNQNMVRGRRLCDRYCNSLSKCVGHSCLRDAVSCRYAPYLSWKVPVLTNCNPPLQALTSTTTKPPGSNTDLPHYLGSSWPSKGNEEEVSFLGVDIRSMVSVPSELVKLVAQQNNLK